MNAPFLAPVTRDGLVLQVLPSIESFADLEIGVGKLAASRLVSNLRKHMVGSDAGMTDAEVFDDVALWFLRTGELEAFICIRDEDDPQCCFHSGRQDICEGPEAVQ